MLIAAPQHLYCIWHALTGGALFKKRCYFCLWHQPNATQVCFCMPCIQVMTQHQHTHTNGQMFYLLPPPLENRQVLQTPSPSYQSNATWETVSGEWIYLTPDTQPSQALFEVSKVPYLECELEIEIQDVWGRSRLIRKLHLQFVDMKKAVWKDHLYDYLHFFCVLWPRFCEHEEEDISGACDVQLIVLERLFPSPYFYFCSDMPGTPLNSRRNRKMFTVPLGPRQRHLWYPKPWG